MNSPILQNFSASVASESALVSSDPKHSAKHTLEPVLYVSGLSSLWFKQRSSSVKGRQYQDIQKVSVQKAVARHTAGTFENGGTVISGVIERHRLGRVTAGAA
jgi:hypothetical protein